MREVLRKHWPRLQSESAFLAAGTVADHLEQSKVRIHG
jgi:hypothetical protein